LHWSLVAGLIKQINPHIQFGSVESPEAEKERRKREKEVRPQTRPTHHAARSAQRTAHSTEVPRLLLEKEVRHSPRGICCTMCAFESSTLCRAPLTARAMAWRGPT
jgi:hypothetical protein